MENSQCFQRIEQKYVLHRQVYHRLRQQLEKRKTTCTMVGIRKPRFCGKWITCASFTASCALLPGLATPGLHWPA